MALTIAGSGAVITGTFSPNSVGIMTAQASVIEGKAVSDYSLYTGGVNTDLTIKRKPDNKSASMGVLKKGTPVVIYEVNNGFGRIDKGWIQLRYVTVDLNTVFKDIKNIKNIKAVEFVFKNQFMVGKPSNDSKKNTFAPKETIKRSDIVSVIYNMAGKPYTHYERIFKDVTFDKPCKYAVTWAYRNDIVAGYANGNFGINDDVTIEQVAQMLFKYAKLCGYDTSFTKGESSKYKQSDWAKKSGAVDWAVHQKILTKANTNSSYNATQKASRELCADMVKNLMENHL
ncbi:S-layer homology domain-containing protein [Ruminococcus albus]|nr:S-layer homology domain-containing protein [Ruminococcus albus]